MAKSENLNLPQTIITGSVGFNSSDDYGVFAIAVTIAGTNLTAGTRTFTAAGGILINGGAGAATWTLTAKSDGTNVFVAGTPAITQIGQYKAGAGPTASANAPAVDTGTNNSTYSLSTGIVKLMHTASAEGEVVTALNAVSTDSVDRVVTILRQKATSGEMNPLIYVKVVAGSGTNGTTAATDILSSALLPGAARDAMNKPILKLAPGDKLYVAVPAVSASCLLRVNFTSEDLTAPA